MSKDLIVTNCNVVQRMASCPKLVARSSSRKDARKERTQDERELTTVTAQLKHSAQTLRRTHKTIVQLHTRRALTNFTIVT